MVPEYSPQSRDEESFLSKKTFTDFLPTKILLNRFDLQRQLRLQLRKRNWNYKISCKSWRCINRNLA